jgi:putative FmdB family regulatory protein
LPTYEYRCEACGHTFELFQKFADKPVETCELCGARVNKVLHPVAIHFKGSGFYTTDYGRGSKTARAADSGAKADAESADAAKDTAGAKGSGSAKSTDGAGQGEAKAKAAGNGGGAGSSKAAGSGGGDAAKPSKTDKAG